MARARLRDRLRYWFDGTMDRGTPALIGWLGLASVVLIAVVTVLVVVFTNSDTEKNGGWLGVAWMSLLRTLDPGTMGGDTGGPVFLGLMLTVTIGGIFIVSALIGVLTTGLEAKIQELRKGKSRLIEHEHTVVLGWSEQVFTVIGELVEANQSERRSCVVILADRDKVAMEDEIRRRIPETGRTRVVCRSGSPLQRADLELVSLDAAKSVMVLPPVGDDSDTDVIKVLLLLNSRRWKGTRPNIVAAVQNSPNLAAARLAAGEDALVIDAEDIAVRLIVQSHRQSGLSTVFNELLSFVGNEFYPYPATALAGTSYGETLDRFDLGVPVGLRRADGTTLINPPMDTAIGGTDQVLVIAEDDILIRLAESRPRVVASAIAPPADRLPVPDRTLVIGWNSRGVKIVRLLDRLVEPGALLDVAAPRPPAEDLRDQLAHLTVGYQPCEPTLRPSLESLGLDRYSHIIVLTDDDIHPERSDDRALVTLLHLRDIAIRSGNPYSIVTEMNSDANREIAQVTKADDFIVSTKIISLLLTQLTEDRDLHAVFTDLFDPEGSEIYLKPAASYLTPGTTANFTTVIEAARQRGETAIGYRLARHGDTPPTYGVVLNPAKAEPLVLGEGDAVVVLAEDGRVTANVPGPRKEHGKVGPGLPRP
ncbi:potassium transporter TrkA [Streptomyces noursei ZPM]|uniref:Lipoprotein n=1 Tax=Streptomyces noursei TaxID=1971 RepID=A0A401RDK0_STRNR|nr:potassium transporter TrkA [Streptomyces noursei]AKA07713.1 potassium transporter TrkA [Streptomyces noursei ZPM]EXU89791.1 potassium transporter TrkA [Streptomyces noursei PD-1]UWS76304.1 potassium transporter TrkA [Streptomyces noursei]GCB95702.1 lipoprotein [Streptomyces noursei]